MNGWIKLHRQILKREWYKDVSTFKLFMHILLKASHKEKKWRGIDIGPGQLITGRRSLAMETGLTEQQIRTSTKRLINNQQITSKSTNKYSLITVCNWAKFQITETEATNNQPAKTPTNNPLTNHKQEYKNIKNYKNTLDTVADAPIENSLDTECIQNVYTPGTVVPVDTPPHIATTPPKKKAKAFVAPTLAQVIEYVVGKGYQEQFAKRIYSYYVEGDWHDSKGKQVVNWKQKINGARLTPNNDNQKALVSQQKATAEEIEAIRQREKEKLAKFYS